MTTKTPEEIQALKESWFKDPTWDLEDTEGFEAHREELIAYSVVSKRVWRIEPPWLVWTHGPEGWEPNGFQQESLAIRFISEAAQQGVLAVLTRRHQLSTRPVDDDES